MQRLLLFLAATFLFADDSDRILRIDHYVEVKSTAPGMNGQTGHIYVREVAKAGGVLRGGPHADKVVLFIHGAGTPAHVAFDVPHQGYSWMEYLANSGFDVFAMDMTGYGRSSRPAAMSDTCNLSPEQQAQFAKKCNTTAGAAGPITTWASDWNDIGAVVDHIRGLRRVDKLNLIGWSLGGPRTIGYTAEHLDKVRSIVLLAPAYNRMPSQRASTQPLFNTQSRQEFDANWDRQLGCPAQYEPAVREAVWKAMLDSDPVGATWGPGVRRAPNTGSSGSMPAAVKKTTTPTLIVSAVHDVQAPAARLRELFEDLGSTQKVFLDLGCASHNIPWEKNRTHLFQASADWFLKGEVNGAKQGVTKLGY
jgi:pimeloyl-ACP methyl ester carboxylesterase